MTHGAAHSPRYSPPNVVQAPWTQNVTLGWRPELRFYQERVAILKTLEDRGLLKAFRVGSDRVDGRLVDDAHELSINESSLTLRVRTPFGGPELWERMWEAADYAVKRIGPARYHRISVAFQHVVELPLAFEEAVRRGYDRLFGGAAGSPIPFGDWAYLTNLALDEPPAYGYTEFGIVEAEELPDRLSRAVGRTYGSGREGGYSWRADMFKEVSLFADTSLQSNVDEVGTETFLSRARYVWEESSRQVGTFVTKLHERLTEEEDGHEVDQ
jgi:hypothetical protein